MSQLPGSAKEAIEVPLFSPPSSSSSSSRRGGDSSSEDSGSEDEATATAQREMGTLEFARVLKLEAPASVVRPICFLSFVCSSKLTPF